MTEVNPPIALQNAGSVHTAQVLRNAVNALATSANAASSLRARSGVHVDLGGALKVQQAGAPNMTVDVLSGVALIAGSENSAQGIYSVLNDATKNISIAASDPSLPRIDLICYKVQDTFYSGAVNSSSIVAVTGTPNSSPVAPTAPANSITIAQIAVGAGVTSIVNANITDTRTFLGFGMLTVGSITERDAIGGLHPGNKVWRRDLSMYQVWDGASWFNYPTGAWTDFSSSAIISASGGGFVKGSTTYVAQYQQINKTVTYAGTVLINTGGGFATGSGVWNFLLPITAAARTVNAGVGVGWINDSGTTIYATAAYVSDTTHLVIQQNNIGGSLSATGPGTAWATNDRVSWTITYEAA